MHKAKYVMPVLLAATVAIGGTGCMLYRGAPPLELTVYFHPFVGPAPLIFNDARYPNPGGEGRFKVRDFQFFLSNIRLVGARGAYAEPDSYHLVRFDGAEPGFAIVLRDVPRRDYERIEFGIGVDAAANKSLAQRGDLDPNGRMAWTWEVGYKFVLFEGALVRGDASAALVYHVGFDENYTLVSAELNGDPLDSDTGRLDFRVDILRLFQGAATIDMAALPAVKFDHADAALLARNFAGMITPMQRPVGGSIRRGASSCAAPSGLSQRGKPSTRCAMMLRCTSEVPA
jgi:methanobactin biosynthesis MbnP-like protein